MVCVVGGPAGSGLDCRRRDWLDERLSGRMEYWLADFLAVGLDG